MRQLMGSRWLVRALAAAAVVNLGVALWDLATGGFRFEFLGLRISSWEVYKPLRNALLCTVPAVWLHDRAADPASTVWARVERYARPIAAVFVVAWVSITIAYSARAVGGSDTYGYVSEAQLWASGRLVVHDKLAELAPLIGPAVAPLGYQLARVPGAIVPTYSPGLPLVMAAAMKVTRQATAVYYVVPLLGAIGIWLTYLLAARAGGPVAGLFAAAAIGMSPIYLFEALHPMSDVPVTTWWLLAWLLVSLPGRWTAAGAGLAVSMAVLTRPNLAPLALALLPVAMIDRPRIARGASFVLAVAPGCLAIGALNAYLYGSPLSSGYGSLESLYRWSHWPDNLHNYGSWLLKQYSPAILLAVAAPFVADVRRVGPQLAFCAAVVLSYLFYFVYDNWTYLRFLLPAIAVLVVLASIVIAALLRRIPISVRGVAIVVVALLPFWYEPQSEGFNIFGVAPGQQRFATIGQVLGRRLPPNAAVLSVVHSGSIRMYGDRATVRWELIPADRLDDTISILRGHGYASYIFVEDFEEPPFRDRFSGASAIGGLDWPPAIEFFGEWRAKVYAVDDRAAFLAGRHVDRTVVPLRGGAPPK